MLRSSLNSKFKPVAFFTENQVQKNLSPVIQQERDQYIQVFISMACHLKNANLATLCSVIARSLLVFLLALHNLPFSPIDTSQMIDISFFWQLRFQFKNSFGNSDTYLWQLRWQLQRMPLATPISVQKQLWQLRYIPLATPLATPKTAFCNSEIDFL